jgi:hypothetical protein
MKSIFPWALLAGIVACGRDLDHEPLTMAGEVPSIPAAPADDLHAKGSSPVDRSRGEGRRLLPAEVQLRAFTEAFGDLPPAEVEALVRAGDPKSFDRFRDYLASLGLPDPSDDVPRAEAPNAMLLAVQERLGAALCERSLARERAIPVDARAIFAFDVAGEPTAADFATRFDLLHRTFLGYPAALAPASRVARFRELFVAVMRTTSARAAARPTVTPVEAAWVAVCHALVRHPEYVTY